MFRRILSSIFVLLTSSSAFAQDQVVEIDIDSAYSPSVSLGLILSGGNVIQKNRCKCKKP